MRSLFSITVTVSTPVDTEEVYIEKSDAIAQALSEVLASKTALEELTNTKDLLISAHTECELTHEDDNTIVASCVLDLESPEDPVQVSKPLLSKHIKKLLSSYGKLKIEKRVMDLPEPPA
jgi:hypothetical protein